VVQGTLIPEAELRRFGTGCDTFFGHPDGVWLLLVRGEFIGATRTARIGIDAVTRKKLCAQDSAVAPPVPTIPFGIILPSPTLVIPTVTSIPTQLPGYPGPTSL